MIFVDTGAWFAAFVPTDADHTVARAWLVRNQAPLLTTDYVIDELLTLMRMRGENRRALRVGQSLFDQELAELHLVSPDDIHAAWGVYRQFSDKQWSFTDCVSKVVMVSRGIQTAFAFDAHFRQFGAVTVVPSGQ
ncbi:PIN domain-containing protein [uncultured Thiodictyon sp.]|uniref:type II toxin-antitoxin system VapC family toxin n=1 Tax=uncultured Thiodictyon sp. TaxID=1846217 RepID=UPI0025D001E5|nr:PIN domain-containing protein [uncultured Thiodictyon sp.]